MKYILNKSHKKLGVVMFILTPLLIGTLFLFLNKLTPLFADDYSYSFSFSNGQRINSIIDIFSSQSAHYNILNGRIITHFLAQLFLYLGKDVFNIINTLSFVVLIYLIYFHAMGTFKHFSLTRFVFIAMLLFLCTPAFGQSFLWITGSANYLYGILIVLIAILPYRLQAKCTEKTAIRVKEIILAILYIPVCIVAGWTTENSSVAMIAMILAYIISFKFNGIKIRAWHITGFISAIIGCYMMLSAPGTSGRLSQAGGIGSFVDIIKRFIFNTCDMFIYLHLVFIIFLILLMNYLFYKTNEVRQKSICKFYFCLDKLGVMLIYLIGFLASVYSMIVSPQFPERVWSFPVVLFLITTANLSTYVKIEPFKFKIYKAVALCFVIILFFSTYINAFLEIKNINIEYCNRVSTIICAVDAGESSVQLKSIKGYSGYSVYSPYGDLSVESNEWPNTAIAKYYGLDEVKYSD